MQRENRLLRLTFRGPKALRGFTLAELFVTLGMLVLIIAITLGVVEASYDRAYRARAKIELRHRSRNALLPKRNCRMLMC